MVQRSHFCWFSFLIFGGPTWRIIPFSKWLITFIYKPFRSFGRRTTPVRGFTNHSCQLLTNWDDPPSTLVFFCDFHHRHPVGARNPGLKSNQDFMGFILVNKKQQNHCDTCDIDDIVFNGSTNQLVQEFVYQEYDMGLSYLDVPLEVRIKG